MARLNHACKVYLLLTCTCKLLALKPRPNIVILLADDLGIADIGPYGNTSLHTPNLDSLARDGMKLTHHLAAESICTPSRAALLTGRYTKRYGMDSGAFRLLMNLASPTGLPTTELTFPELVKSAGYKTALIGKWHLGLYDFYGNPVYHPVNRGFDYFYGLPFSLAVDNGDEGIQTMTIIFPTLKRNIIMSIFVTIISLVLLLQVGIIKPRLFVFLSLFAAVVYIYLYIFLYCVTLSSGVLMKNFETIEMPVKVVGLTKRLAREGVEFIKNQTSSDQPFLLFMSWGHTHTFLAPSSKFAGRSQHGRYGDCVEELDWGIGMILKALEETKSRDNTLVYFTSDHGASPFDFGADGQVDGGYNGIYRGGKGIGGFDGGIRVPGLFRWPDVIRPDSVSDLVTTQLDILPLISAVSNIHLPEDRVIDGKDIVPVLQGKATRSPYSFVFHYCNGIIVAVRFMPPNDSMVWKLVYRARSNVLSSTYTMADTHCKNYVSLNPPFLFDINKDPGEMNPLNIDAEPKYKEIVSIIDEATEKHRNSIPHVDSRLSLMRILWWPHLQPCCNFPLCSCVEEKYKDADIY